MEYLIHYFEFKYVTSLISCKFPTLFSTMKLAHNFSQFIQRFKIVIFECWPWARLPNFSQFLKEMEKWDFQMSANLAILQISMMSLSNSSYWLMITRTSMREGPKLTEDLRGTKMFGIYNLSYMP